MKVTVTFVPKEEKTNTNMERLLLELDLSLPASKVKLNALSETIYFFSHVNWQFLIYKGGKIAE